jgi:hypothetical protein
VVLIKPRQNQSALSRDFLTYKFVQKTHVLLAWLFISPPAGSRVVPQNQTRMQLFIVHLGSSAIQRFCVSRLPVMTILTLALARHSFPSEFSFQPMLRNCAFGTDRASATNSLSFQRLPNGPEASEFVGFLGRERLFVSQGNHRVDSGGATRRNVASHDGYRS